MVDNRAVAQNDILPFQIPEPIRTADDNFECPDCGNLYKKTAANQVNKSYYSHYRKKHLNLDVEKGEKMSVQSSFDALEGELEETKNKAKFWKNIISLILAIFGLYEVFNNALHCQVAENKSELAWKVVGVVVYFCIFVGTIVIWTYDYLDYMHHN